MAIKVSPNNTVDQTDGISKKRIWILHIFSPLTAPQHWLYHRTSLLSTSMFWCHASHCLCIWSSCAMPSASLLLWELHCLSLKRPPPALTTTTAAPPPAAEQQPTMALCFSSPSSILASLQLLPLCFLAAFHDAYYLLQFQHGNYLRGLCSLFSSSRGEGKKETVSLPHSSISAILIHLCHPFFQMHIKLFI